MPAGRPPFIPQLDPATPGPVTSALCELVDGDRLSIPAKLIAGLGWVEPKTTAECLLALHEGGLVTVLDWAAYAERVLGKRRELIHLASEAADTAHTLAVFDDRYRKSKIESRYLRLYEVREYLFEQAPVGSRILAVRFPDRLELWSRRYRERHLGDRRRLVEDFE